MGTEADRLRLDVLAWLNEWALIFAGYLTYSEVWGASKMGLTSRQALEVSVAYEEWERFNDAYKKWEKHHDKRDEPFFDRQKYVEKRRRGIEKEL